MRSFFWFLLFIIYLIAARWFFVCQVKQLCAEEKPVVEEDIRIKTLDFKDQEKTILKNRDHFRFDSTSLVPVLNQDNIKFLEDISAYLDVNSDRGLKITGGLRTSEEQIQRDFFDNLGVARANELRKLIVAKGIDEDRISLDYFVDTLGGLRRPVTFVGMDTTSHSGAFTFTHMTFSDANFEYNSAAFNPGEAFQAYADSVTTYFGQVDTVTLTIIGHTDSIASQAYNLKLGKDRAESARQYFSTLGIPLDRININSLGKDQPVAPNKTEEGRQKNRRVEIVIQ